MSELTESSASPSPSNPTSLRETYVGYKTGKKILSSTEIQDQGTQGPTLESGPSITDQEDPTIFTTDRRFLPTTDLSYCYEGTDDIYQPKPVWHYPHSSIPWLIHDRSRRKAKPHTAGNTSSREDNTTPNRSNQIQHKDYQLVPASSGSYPQIRLSADPGSYWFLLIRSPQTTDLLAPSLNLKASLYIHWPLLVSVSTAKHASTAVGFNIPNQGQSPPTSGLVDSKLKTPPIWESKEEFLGTPQAYQATTKRWIERLLVLINFHWSCSAKGSLPKRREHCFSASCKGAEEKRELYIKTCWPSDSWAQLEQRRVKEAGEHTFQVLFISGFRVPASRSQIPGHGSKVLDPGPGSPATHLTWREDSRQSDGSFSDIQEALRVAHPRGSREQPEEVTKRHRQKENIYRSSCARALVPWSLQALKDKSTGPPREVASTPQQRSPFLQGPVTGLRIMYPADECQSSLKHQQIHLCRTLHHWEKPTSRTWKYSSRSRSIIWKNDSPPGSNTVQASSDSYEAPALTSASILNTREFAYCISSATCMDQYINSCFSRHGKQRKPGTWVSKPTPAPSKTDSGFLQKAECNMGTRYLWVLNKFLQNLEKVNLQVLYNPRAQQRPQGLKETSGSHTAYESRSNLRVQNDFRVLNTTSGSRGTAGFYTNNLGRSFPWRHVPILLLLLILLSGIHLHGLYDFGRVLPKEFCAIFGARDSLFIEKANTNCPGDKTAPFAPFRCNRPQLLFLSFGLSEKSGPMHHPESLFQQPRPTDPWWFMSRSHQPIIAHDPSTPAQTITLHRAELRWPPTVPS
ncbi:hypothetical protein F2Q68_00034504 [Brassica cretica]|uniref:Uncharacterized protein n=1 Tax=Brassica cretica TaxID=69181 RepID=A0A8S9H2J5_BRACR|nr:hypothetical protein F2Q68_00034504 [Brassica cretica]